MAPQRKMHLVAFLTISPGSIYPSGWRHPASVIDNLFSPTRYENLARLLESARFDAGFFALNQGISDIYRGHYADFLQRGGFMSFLDPLTVMPLMARVTSHLGLGVTISTSFHAPFHIATSLASLDLLSGGRVAWNVVTSAREFEARNYGLERLDAKDTRYDKADDVLEACFKLWDGWDEDALVLDREAGIMVDPTKVRRADHVGPYVRTRGPISIPRSPQGRPVILQAGSSGRGRDFAARWAELIFSSPANKEASLSYVADLARRLQAHGRSREECAVLPSITAVVGETESLAREKAEFLESLVDPELVLAQNSNATGADLSADGTDATKNQGVQGHRDRFEATARDLGITYEEVIRRPRPLVVGTPKMIADYMEDWFTSGACDGFIVPAPVDPGSFEDFARLVVPELQRRNLFRTEYAGCTLRENIRNPG